MPKFVASVAHRDTGMDEYLIREAASERELRDALSDEGLFVRSLRPAEFGGKGARFEIRTPKGRVAGPFGPDLLQAMAQDGHLTPECSIRKTGDLERHDWHPAWKVKGLFPAHVVDEMQRSHTIPSDDDVNAPYSEEADEFAVQIRRYRTLVDEGLLTDEEFAAKKRQMLGIPAQVLHSADPAESAHTEAEGHATRLAEPSELLGWIIVTIPFAGIVLAWGIGTSLPLIGTPTPELFIGVLTVAIVVSTSVLMAVESTSLAPHYRGDPSKRQWSPGEWLLGGLLLWVFVLPMYLRARSRYGVSSRVFLGIGGIVLYVVCALTVSSMAAQMRSGLISGLPF